MLVDLDWEVSDLSTLSRRQKTLIVNIPHRDAQGPLHLLIDSTGIKVEDEGAWNVHKHGGAKRRVWCKVHRGIDAQTPEIRAVEVTSSDVGDAPMLPELLAQITADQDSASVMGGQRLRHPKVPWSHRRSRRCGNLTATQDRKTVEYCKTVQDCHGKCSRAQRSPASIEIPRPRALATMERLPPPKQHRDMSRARKRSRGSFSGEWMLCVKLLGQRLMARDFDRQVAEFQVRAAVLNRFTTFGVPVIETVG